MAEELAFKPQEVINPDLIPNPKQLYSLTWLEYASQNYEQVTRWKYAQNNTQTLYTVPEGRTFYITNASLSLHATNSLAQGDTWITIKKNTNNNRILMLGCMQEDNNVSISQVYPMPIKLNSGDTIQITTNHSNIVGNAEILGFLVPFS